MCKLADKLAEIGIHLDPGTLHSYRARDYMISAMGSERIQVKKQSFPSGVLMLSIRLPINLREGTRPWERDIVWHWVARSEKVHEEDIDTWYEVGGRKLADYSEDYKAWIAGGCKS